MGGWFFLGGGEGEGGRLLVAVAEDDGLGFKVVDLKVGDRFGDGGNRVGLRHLETLGWQEGAGTGHGDEGRGRDCEDAVEEHCVVLMGCFVDFVLFCRGSDCRCPAGSEKGWLTWSGVKNEESRVVNRHYSMLRNGSIVLCNLSCTE